MKKQILNSLPRCDNRGLGKPRVRVIRPGNRASSVKSSKWSREAAKPGGGKWLHSWPGALLEVFVTGPQAIPFLPALKTSRIQRANTLCFPPRFWWDLAKDSKVSVRDGDSSAFLFVGNLQHVRRNHRSSTWGNVSSLEGLEVAPHSHSLLLPPQARSGMEVRRRLRIENESSASPQWMRHVGEGLRGHCRASVAMALVWGGCEELQTCFYWWEWNPSKHQP